MSASRNKSLKYTSHKHYEASEIRPSFSLLPKSLFSDKTKLSSWLFRDCFSKIRLVFISKWNCRAFLDRNDLPSLYIKWSNSDTYLILYISVGQTFLAPLFICKSHTSQECVHLKQAFTIMNIYCSVN